MRSAAQTTGTVDVEGPPAGTWCQRTILPPRMRKTAAARLPGPSHGLDLRSPRTNVARTTGPCAESDTIFPEQGRSVFHATASAWVRSLVTTLPCTTSAFGAKSSAAASLSPSLSALLQARTTLDGEVPPLPQPASRARMQAAAARERTTPRL